MGLDILDKALSFSDRSLEYPWITDVPILHARNTRLRGKSSNLLASGFMNNFGSPNYNRYVSAKERKQFDLLESISLANDLSRNRSDYLGYQYELDRRFGSAGRIVGMASQGLGSIGNLLKIPSLYKPRLR